MTSPSTKRTASFSQQKARLSSCPSRNTRFSTFSLKTRIRLSLKSSSSKKSGAATQTQNTTMSKFTSHLSERRSKTSKSESESGLPVESVILSKMKPAKKIRDVLLLISTSRPKKQNESYQTVTGKIHILNGLN